jgi:hypothetical protein
MKYGTTQSEAYNRLTLDGMRLSSTKTAAVDASMTEGESALSYVFPLLRFHERWKELSSDDLRYMLTKRGVSHNGFMMRCDAKPMGTLPTPPLLADYTLSAVCFDYLEKARVLCEENGIDLILFKAPIMYPHWYPEWDEQLFAYADEHGLLYINALGAIDEIGIDFSTDTYNGGLHLNLQGAEKFALFLGEILHGRGLRDLRSDAAVSKVWAGKARLYYAQKAAQLYELETIGKVVTLTKE